MPDPSAANPPSPFIVHWATKLAPRLPAPRRALDVAMGRGRHALFLASLGLRTFGVDSNFEAIRTAVRAAAAQGLAVRAWCADLTLVSLPRDYFQLVVVTRYLHRDGMAALSDTVAPGGFLIYETFTINQRQFCVGPTSPDHLLEPGELASRFDRLDTVFYDEVPGPEAVARLVASKISRS